ncbi:MAG: hypothetical protein AAF585_22110, partial [Verrucomicrobiota bacterium]
MKIPLPKRQIVSLSAMFAAAWVLLSSCAAPPAKVERVGFQTGATKSDLGPLLETALRDPDVESSKHALASFVENWKRSMGSAAA